jgi:hypothetical protein
MPHSIHLRINSIENRFLHFIQIIKNNTIFNKLSALIVPLQLDRNLMIFILL